MNKMYINRINERVEISRKFKEYEMKIIKMAGYLADYYIDRAIESEDYSNISGFLIDYFSGPAGKPFDVGYLYSKYKEFELDQKIEDIDFNIDEYYKVIYEVENPHSISLEQKITMDMSEEEYIEYLVKKRKNGE
jgi:hypothetical protein